MRAAPKLGAAEILALPSMKLLLALYFLIFFAFNLFYVAFPVYATTAIGWSLLEIGAYFAAMGLMMALVQGPVLTWLSARRSERGRVLGGGIVLAASFPFFISGSTAMIYLGTALLALGNGVMWPSLLAILSRAADRSVQGAVQGFAGSAGATASIAGLLLGGALYHGLGSGVFLISAVVIAACCGLSLLIPPTGPDRS
jgi:MFS family permease